MGMYTELIFGATLKENTPIEIIDTLQVLCGLKEDPMKFNYPKRNPFWANSCYFGAKHNPSMIFEDNQWIISTRGNIKNYDDDIEYFLEWIKPYIEQGSGIKNIYAIVIGETSTEPIFYHLDESEEKDTELTESFVTRLIQRMTNKFPEIRYSYTSDEMSGVYSIKILSPEFNDSTEFDDFISEEMYYYSTLSTGCNLAIYKENEKY